MELLAKRPGLLLLCFGAMLSFSFLLSNCRQEEEGPLVVTQVAMVEGQEVIVTRVVRQTIEVQVTPVIEEGQEPVILDISSQGAYATLDPQVATEENALDIVENIFIGLTRYDLNQDRIVPSLAQSWDISEDGRTWTFHLRDDVFWVRRERPSEGLLGSGDSELQAIRPVVAADVVFAIQRACDPRLRSPDAFILFIIDGCENLNMGLGPALAREDSLGVTAVDDKTLEIRLTRPASHFLAMTSISLLRPVPAEFVVELGDQWHMPENIVTSGPFIVSPETLARTRTVLLRNPLWPMEFQGNVNQVNILHLDDDQDAFRLWRDRNLDISPVPVAEQNAVMAEQDEKLSLIPSQAVFYLSYDFDSPAFSVPEVRRAFSWAIDRERLIREVHGDRNLPMRHFTPPGAIGAPPIDQVGVGYNPDRARLQLSNSIFGDCRLVPPVTYMVSSSDIALQQAELLRDMWIEELGCREDQINIVQVQFGQLLANTRADSIDERPDLWDLGWAAYYPDANNWLGNVLHCTESENRQKRPCAPVDEQITEADRLSDQDERWDLYRQIERNFFGENGLVPIAPLYLRAEYRLTQTWINYTPAYFGGDQYDTFFVDVTAKELERTP